MLPEHLDHPVRLRSRRDIAGDDEPRGRRRRFGFQHRLKRRRDAVDVRDDRDRVKGQHVCCLHRLAALSCHGGDIDVDDQPVANPVG